MVERLILGPVNIAAIETTATDLVTSRFLMVNALRRVTPSGSVRVLSNRSTMAVKGVTLAARLLVMVTVSAPRV